MEHLLCVRQCASCRKHSGEQNCDGLRLKGNYSCDETSFKFFLCKLSNLHKSGQNILMSFHLPTTQIQARATLCAVFALSDPHVFLLNFFRAEHEPCSCCLLRYNKSPKIWMLSHMHFSWLRSLGMTLRILCSGLPQLQPRRRPRLGWPRGSAASSECTRSLAAPSCSWLQD